VSHISLANAVALAQGHTDKGLEWTRDGLGQGLDVLTKEVAKLATRVNHEHQEAMEARAREDSKIFAEVGWRDSKIQELTSEVEELRTRDGMTVDQRQEEDHRMAECRELIGEPGIQTDSREPAVPAGAPPVSQEMVEMRD